MSRAFLQDCREIWNALPEHPRQSALLFFYEIPLTYHVPSAHGISRNADGVLTLEPYAENADACQKRDVLLPIRLFPNIHLNCSQKNRIFSEKGLIFVSNLCTMGHVSRKTFAF